MSLPSSRLGQAQTGYRGKDAQTTLLGRNPLLRKIFYGIILVGVCWILWGLTVKIEEEIFEWTEHEHKVHQSRPHLAKVERYSPEHRYRPAASPIVKVTDKAGKIKVKGQYHN